MRDEIARLAKALEPSFTAPEDAEHAATMMVMALGYELGQPATEADRLRYRAALERLPKGSGESGSNRDPPRFQSICLNRV